MRSRTPRISRSKPNASTSSTPEAFERDPVNLIRLFWIADKSSLPIHPDATRLVTQSLKRIDAELARRSGGEPPVRRDPHLAPRARNDAAPDERSRRARPFHPRLRTRGRDDAVLDVSSLHDRRASPSHRRRAQRHRGGTAARRPSAAERNRPQDHQSNRALSRRLPARHRQGAAAGPFARRRRNRAAPRTPPRPFRGQRRPRRLAGRTSSDHVEHGPGTRSLRSAHRGSAGGDRADAGTAQDAAGADRLRHPRGRPRRLERLERPVAAHALSGKPRWC